MKKYFMNESGEELTFGDKLVLDLTEDMENGHVKHQHLDCKFIPDLIPLLLESDIIREEEVDDEETNGKPLDFVDDDDDCENCDECPMLCAIYGAHQDLSERIDKIQDSLEKMASVLATMSNTLRSLTQAVTKQKPKKNGGKQED